MDTVHGNYDEPSMTARLLRQEGQRICPDKLRRSSPKSLGGACCIAFWFEKYLTVWIES
jgi:hypothetical protein